MATGAAAGAAGFIDYFFFLVIVDDSVISIVFSAFSGTSFFTTYFFSYSFLYIIGVFHASKLSQFNPMKNMCYLNLFKSLF